jgi:hypothetical protein
MPFIAVWGLDKGIMDPTLYILRRNIKTAVASIPELHIAPEQVTVKFDDERASDPLEVMAVVFGLSPKEERTESVRNAVAQAIVNEIRGIVDPAGLIECFIMPYAIGFAVKVAEPPRRRG